jgi:hypothetical protein
MVRSWGLFHETEVMMHGNISGPYYKGSGPSGVVKATHDGNTANNTGGTGGESLPQKPIASPENPGPPISMRKALTKKDNSGKGPGAPNKGTSYPGSVG